MKKYTWKYNFIRAYDDVLTSSVGYPNVKDIVEHGLMQESTRTPSWNKSC